MQTSINFIEVPKEGKISNPVSKDIMKLERMQEKLNTLAEKWENESQKDLFSDECEQAFEEWDSYYMECMRFSKNLLREMKKEQRKFVS